MKEKEVIEIDKEVMDFETDVTYTEQDNILIYTAKGIGHAFVYYDQNERSFYLSDSNMAQLIEMDVEEYVTKKKEYNAFQFKPEADSLLFKTLEDCNKFVDEVFIPKIMLKIVS